MAYQLVAQSAIFMIQLQVVIVGSFILIDFDLIVAFQTVDVHLFHFHDEVDLAGFQSDGTGRTFRDNLPDHILDFGLSVPIILKGFKSEAVAHLPLFEHIGAGADGVLIEVVAFVNKLFGNDGIAGACQIVQNDGTGLKSGDLNGFVVHNIHLFDVLCAGLDQREILRPIQGGLHIFHCHFFTSMEFDPFADFEFPFGIADGFIALRQAGFRFHIHAPPQKAFVSQKIHIATGHSIVLVVGQGGSLAHCGNDDGILGTAFGIAFVLFTPGHAGKQSCRHGKKGQYTDQTLSSVTHAFHLFHHMRGALRAGMLFHSGLAASGMTYYMLFSSSPAIPLRNFRASIFIQFVHFIFELKVVISVTSIKFSSYLLHTFLFFVKFILYHWGIFARFHKCPKFIITILCSKLLHFLANKKADAGFTASAFRYFRRLLIRPGSRIRNGPG